MRKIENENKEEKGSYIKRWMRGLKQNGDEMIMCIKNHIIRDDNLSIF